MSTRPDPLERQSHWDGRYREIGSDRVSWYETVPRLSLDLIDRVGVPLTTSVIDIGGGASALAGALVRLGVLDVTVLDISERALHEARAHLPRPDSVHWVHADLLGWSPPRRWGLWHDRAVFHFLTEPWERDTYRRLLHHAVEPGGVVLISTFAVDGPETCSGLPVRRYDASELLEEVGPGFAELAHGRHIHVTPTGAEQPLTWVALRAPADLPVPERAVR